MPMDLKEFASKALAAGVEGSISAAKKLEKLTKGAMRLYDRIADALPVPLPRFGKDDNGYEKPHERWEPPPPPPRPAREPAREPAVPVTEAPAPPPAGISTSQLEAKARAKAAEPPPVAVAAAPAAGPDDERPPAPANARELLEKKTVAQLQALLEEAGVPFPKKGARKADLVDLLSKL